ncbi:MAG TPA: response regulator transcription factor [Rubrobacteraceae bacterium]|nr:response regulator transcription factor [Rubrobacteraceae bacterium]
MTLEVLRPGAHRRVSGDGTKVFIVAPAPVERAGLRAMLEDDGTGMFVVGEAGSFAGPETLAADIVVVAGDEALEEADAGNGAQAILLLSHDDRSVPILRSLAASGWGIVTPDASAEELSAAVASVARGLVLFTRTMAERLLGGNMALEELDEPLTAREREVLDLLGRGLSNKMIGRELSISEHTVKFHVSSVYAKLGASNRTEALSLGARHGLISL